MNLQETNRLLVFVKSLDNRKPDDVTVTSWQLILETDTFEDCEQAVIDHFRTKPDIYLNPGHIHAGAVVARQERERKADHQAAVDRAAARDARAVEGPKATPEEIAQLKADLRAKLPASDPAKLRPRKAEWERKQRGHSKPAGIFGSVGLRLVADLAPDTESEAS